MSGHIGQGKQSDGSKISKLESLQSTSLAVTEMVKQWTPDNSQSIRSLLSVQSTNMDFEADLNDPLEQAMAVRDKPRQQQQQQQQQQQRPHSARGSATPRGRGRGRGRRSNSMCVKNPNYNQISDGQNKQRDSDSFSDSSWGEGTDNSRWHQPNKKGYRGRGRRGSHSGPYNNNFPVAERSGKQKVEVYDLIDVLLEYSDFSASLLQLMEKNHMSPSFVRNLVSSYDHVFELRDEIVVLHPRTKICSDHTGSSGCQNQSSCKNFHICPRYVLSWCQEKNCVYGHRWFTDHNKYVLKSFHIDYISADYLRRLIQSVASKAGSGGQLDICKEYNGNGCNKSPCDSLHICQSFIAGRSKCSHSNCQLSHDILSMECSRLLMSHGIPTNEAPRDVVLALISANPHFIPLASGVNSDDKIKQNGAPVSNNAKQSSAPILEDRKDDNSSTDGKDRDSEKISSNKSKAEKSSDRSSQKKTKESKDKEKNTDKSEKVSSALQTVWSHDFHGDTFIPEICYYSVEGMCRNEANGCDRLHSTMHFHWQVSEQGSNWLNLSKQLTKALECGFCDVNTDDITLPRLDPGKLEPALKGLFTLMGRDAWKANFPAMILTSSDFSKVMYLRRLCTQAVDGKDIKAGKYHWYFLDKNQKWVEYGNVDTAGETNLVSNVTSDDIERHFTRGGGKPLNFQNASYKYSLDFSRMTQKNLNTNVVREVRRRPDPHVEIEKKMRAGSSKSPDADGIPAAWDPMQPQERMRLVPLSANSSEYQSVLNLIDGSTANLYPFNPAGFGGNLAQINAFNAPMNLQNMLPIRRGGTQPYQRMRSILRGGIQVIKIERIQNPYLYKAFQNKVKEMTAVYRDRKLVDVRQLFHGTKSSVVQNICVENFDWRLHGTSSGQSHGRGVYFSPNSQTSVGYCSPDTSTGERHLFVARVAVGSITPGNSSMARPPLNPATGVPYDSTGDGVNVVVKYDKQEYYPEYLITIQ